MSLTNPILSEIDAAHQNLSPPAQQAIALHVSAMNQPQPVAGTNPRLIPEELGKQSVAYAQPAPQMKPLGVPQAPMPSLGPAPSMQVNAPRGTSTGDETELGRLQSTGSGVSQIHNPWLRGLGMAGDALASTFVPGLAQNIPGTTAHHNLLVNQTQRGVNADVANEEKQAATQHTQAETGLVGAQTESLPAQQALQRQLTQSEIDKNSATVEGQSNDIHHQYSQAVTDALDRGVDPMKDPKVQQLADSITSIQKPAATKTEQRDDKAIAIMAKPAAQRTPEENAYMTGYDQYVKKNKLDPAGVRASVMLQMPEAVADPNNPGNVIYATKKQSIGMGAPTGMDTKSAAALNKDFTSGTDAKTLTNINTADAHIKQLSQIAGALHNGNLQLANQIANEYKTQTGEAAPLNFQLLKTALAAEIGKTTSGGVATVEETKELSKALNAANSPNQLAGVTSAASTLMHSKREQLQNQYKAGMQGQPNFGEQGAPAGATHEVHDASGALIGHVINGKFQALGK